MGLPAEAGAGVSGGVQATCRPARRPWIVAAGLAAALATVALGVSAGFLRAQNTHVLLIAGLGGDPEYTDAFHGWLSRFADAASEKYGVGPERIVYLGEKPELDPTRIAARSTAENIRAAFANLGASMATGDELVVLLVGHGTFRNGDARFNIPGPDLAPEEFGFMLEGLGDRRITFVNTSSASGPFVEALSSPNRTIITATRTGRERNMTRFGLHFVDAFAGEDADVNKDAKVSMLEAFGYALREVEREYEGDNQLLTEHAVLDDNGDGEGSREMDEVGGDGALARQSFLSSAGGAIAEQAAYDPVLRALYQEKAEIESRIADLRMVKAQLSLERYEDELEALLVELALKNREIRAAASR